MKKYIGIISFTLIILVICFFAANITRVIDPGVTTFRLSIFVGFVYFIAVELMRIVFQGNGF
jgi:hypothetical protein